jgi:phage repressor protein C with HTH and peptisase S24 domain
MQYLLTKRGVQEKDIKPTLAKACGVSYSAVRQWFSKDVAEGGIRLEHVIAIALKYRVSLDWLALGRGPMDETAAENMRQALGDHSANRKAKIGQSDLPEWVTIQMFDVGESAGAGPAMPEGFVQVIYGFTVSREWLKYLGVPFTSVENLAMLTSDSDEMLGTYQPGDALLIDRGVKEFKENSVYVARIGERIVIKRLQLMNDGVIKVISDNPKYLPDDIKPEVRDTQLRIIAKVLLAFNTRRL